MPKRWRWEGACGEGGPPRSNQREVEELWRAHQSEKQRAAAGSQRFTATSYFTAYVGGKSAVRIPRRRSGGGTPYLPVPFDVHKFLLPNGPGLWRAPRTLTCSESLDLNDGPVVLHYPNMGYTHWRRKYEILGTFGNEWWGRVPCRIPAHLQSRDVLHGEADEEVVKAFYRAVIMREDGSDELSMLRERGLLVRVGFVRAVLSCERVTCQKGDARDACARSSLTALPDLSALKSLQTLDLRGCSSLTALPDLSALTDLKVENLPYHLTPWEEGCFKAWSRD